MTLLIDNYDSFSYNLVQLVGELDPDVKVIRNDEMTLKEIRALKPDRVILSPGPGRPEDAGVTMEAAKELGKDCPVLGVCLGHQAICHALGGEIVYAQKLMHGKQSRISLDKDCPLFKGLPDTILAGRYHSLAADPNSLPDELTACALADDGEVMAVMHRQLPLYGLQFHPESIMTPEGDKILKNFLKETAPAKEAEK